VGRNVFPPPNGSGKFPSKPLSISKKLLGVLATYPDPLASRLPFIPSRLPAFPPGSGAFGGSCHPLIPLPVLHPVQPAKPITGKRRVICRLRIHAGRALTCLGCPAFPADQRHDGLRWPFRPVCPLIEGVSEKKDRRSRIRTPSIP